MSSSVVRSFRINQIGTRRDAVDAAKAFLVFYINDPELKKYRNATEQDKMGTDYRVALLLRYSRQLGRIR